MPTCRSSASFRGVFAERGGYRQTISLSASFLMLMVFATTETLTRLPVGQPFATGPSDPALLPIRLALLLGFVLLVIHQVRQIRESNRRTLRWLQMVGAR